jgi:HEAT repeat protein
MKKKTVVRMTALLLSVVLLSTACSQKPPEKPLVDLVGALKANDEAARIMAAEALGERGPTETGQAVQALTEALKDRSPNVRRAAVKALGQIGAEARSAIPALQKSLKDPDDGVRLSAEKALQEIGRK